MRIAKYVAKCSSYSRRDSEKLVFDGCISVSGVVIRDPAYRILQEDVVYLRGVRLVMPSETAVLMYNKPIGSITTTSDPMNRPIVYDSLPDKFRNLMSVGRLDRNSEGLLLFTDNGDLSRYMELPSSAIERVYEVTVKSPQDFNFSSFKSELSAGVNLKGIRYIPIDVDLIVRQDWIYKIKFILKEGKNREIRVISDAFGLKVIKLVRVAFGMFELGDLRMKGFRSAPKDIVDFYLEKVYCGKLS